MKKVISVLLSLVIAFSMTAGMNISAFAEETTGKCGENVYWRYDKSTKTGYVYGTGATYDAYSYTSDGWFSTPFDYDIDDEMTKVVFEEGITYIGYRFLARASSLDTVIFAKSVNYISSGVISYNFKDKIDVCFLGKNCSFDENSEQPCFSHRTLYENDTYIYSKYNIVLNCSSDSNILEYAKRNGYKYYIDDCNHSKKHSVDKYYYFDDYTRLVYVCKYCGSYLGFISNNMNAVKHSYVKYKTIGSCANAQVVDQYKCSVCGFITLNQGEKVAHTKSSTNSNKYVQYTKIPLKYPSNTYVFESFFDNKGYYNLAFINYDEKYNVTGVTIDRYNSSFKCVSTIKISTKYKSVSKIIQKAGYYYILWGQSDTDNQNVVVTSVAKYDYDGKFVASCNIKGYDSWYRADDDWGTKEPFRSANSDMVINKNNVLCCTYSRTMYNGHQSNFVFYVDCNTMKRLGTNNDVPYTSHCFQNTVNTTEEGGFIISGKGDAYSRGFNLFEINSNLNYEFEWTPFHFTEGYDYDYGYNSVFASTADFIETENGYMLIGSSEKDLSLSPHPLGRFVEYENMMCQVFNKAYKYNSNTKQYEKVDKIRTIVNGVDRIPTGQHKNSVGNNKYFLNESMIDDDVIWLTNYTKGKQSAANPQAVKIAKDKVLVMWENRIYSSEYNVNFSLSYLIINDKGKIIQEETTISDAAIDGSTLPVYKNGYIYWYAEKDYKPYVNILNVDHKFKATVTPATCTQNAKITISNCSHCNKAYPYKVSGAVHRYKTSQTTCKTCGAKYSTKVGKISTAKKAHTKGTAKKENVVKSTCVKKGSYDSVVYCTVCKKELSRTAKTTDIIAHKEAKAKKENIKNATCTKDGSYNLVVRCVTCNKVLSKTSYKINKLGHSYGKAKTVAATYTSNAKKVSTCTRCNAKKTEEIPYTIKPKKTGFSTVSAGKTSIKLAWATTGKAYYEIQYSKNKNFSSKKSITKQASSTTISNLSKNTTYYVRIRSFYYNKDKTKRYSEWSSVKAVKTTK